jgi:hypothetical protein
MRRGSVGLAFLFRLLLFRQFTDLMTLAGTAEDQQAGRQRETGSAKKKSHNAGAH